MPMESSQQLISKGSQSTVVQHTFSLENERRRSKANPYLIELQAGLMPRVHSVKTQLLQTVGVVVARVAFQMDWVPNGHALEPPLVGFAPLLDMCHQLVFLHMLVRLTMELEVGLELGVVAAQLALVRVPHHRLPLVLREASLHVHVEAQHVQIICSELVAHSALEELQRRVIRLCETFTQVHELLRHQLSTTQPHVQGDLATHCTKKKGKKSSERLNFLPENIHRGEHKLLPRANCVPTNTQ